MPTDPNAAAFFDVDNTMMQGASIYWFARGLAARNYFTTGDLARFAWEQLRFRLLATEHAGDMSQAKEAALAFVEGWRVDDIERLSEEIFDELMADRIWSGTRALAQLHLDAGQRVWLVTAAPVELGRVIAERLGLTGAHRHGRRDPRRRLHRPAGRRHACTAPAKADAIRAARRRRRARPEPVHGVQRLGQRRADAVRRRAARSPSTPTARCAARPASSGWDIRDFRTGRKAAKVAVPVDARRRARRRRGRRVAVSAAGVARTPAHTWTP